MNERYRVCGDEPQHEHLPLLADAVSARRRLCINGHDTQGTTVARNNSQHAWASNIEFGTRGCGGLARDREWGR